jgi:hypothetical protein
MSFFLELQELVKLIYLWDEIFEDASAATFDRLLHHSTDKE